MFANDVALLFSMTDEEELFVQFSSESISFLLFLFICTGWIVVYRYTFNYLICSEGLSIKFVAWTGSNFENFTSNWTSNSNLKLSFMVIISQKKRTKTVMVHFIKVLSIGNLCTLVNSRTYEGRMCMPLVAKKNNSWLNANAYIDI